MKTLAQLQRDAARTELEDTLAFQLSAELVSYRRQVLLVEDRKLVWDFVLDGPRIAVEVQGGTHTQGAHNRARGMNRDCEKAVLAALAGYLPIAVTGDQVKSGEACGWICDLAEMRAAS